MYQYNVQTISLLFVYQATGGLVTAVTVKQKPPFTHLEQPRARLGHTTAELKYLWCRARIHSYTLNETCSKTFCQLSFDHSVCYMYYLYCLRVNVKHY